MCVTLYALRAQAQSHVTTAGELLVGAGVFNVLDGGDKDGLLLSLEYRPSIAVWRARPLLSFARASGGSVFASGGAVFVVPFGRQFELAGGFAPTLHHAHGEPDLGHRVAFYSFAEFLWRRASGTGLRARFGHISNAGLGLVNPGIEVAQLQLSIPLGAVQKPPAGGR